MEMRANEQTSPRPGLSISRFCARAADGWASTPQFNSIGRSLFLFAGHQFTHLVLSRFAADAFPPFGVRAGGGRNVVVRDEAGRNCPESGQTRTDAEVVGYKGERHKPS